MKKILRVILLFSLSVITLNSHGRPAIKDSDLLELYSRAADEYMVTFDAVAATNLTSIEQVKSFTNNQKFDFEEYTLKPLTKFIFGPLTYRQLGGEQKGFRYVIKWSEAYLQNNQVIIPFQYSGQWLVNKKIQPNVNFEIPLPLNINNLKTTSWKKCTDSYPDHQDFQSLWYYWDPTRRGCDHKLGVQFQNINPILSKKTTQSVQSYPEYNNLIRNNKMSMTFGFGYVEDPINPDPFSDNDSGMYEFRSFIERARFSLRLFNFKELPIYEKEYLGGLTPERRIGTRFIFNKKNVEYEVKVIASGSIDQMELFAKSFSHDHDGFFGWFGHSRVGNGFDAFKFNSLVRQNRKFYSVIPDYQLIYWAGCNSYSYYTKPFFEFKANLIPSDTNGTKSLDIISNGLPSYFSLNADNAEVLLKALTNPELPMSYQQIVDKLEKTANASGIYVLVNVLGDEDNN